jgi:hypothetical protein
MGKVKSVATHTVVLTEEDVRKALFDYARREVRDFRNLGEWSDPGEDVSIELQAAGDLFSAVTATVVIRSTEEE